MKRRGTEVLVVFAGSQSNLCAKRQLTFSDRLLSWVLITLYENWKVFLCLQISNLYAVVHFFVCRFVNFYKFLLFSAVVMLNARLTEVNQNPQ